MLLSKRAQAARALAAAGAAPEDLVVTSDADEIPSGRVLNQIVACGDALEDALAGAAGLPRRPERPPDVESTAA